jgi:DNA-nicking Smr family endonuclease
METTRRNRLTEADRAAWASFAARIRPLAGRDHPPPAANAAPQIVQPRLPRPVAPGRISRGTHPSLSVGDHPGGVDSATWRRFRTGKLAAARVLDLHGQTAQRAFSALVSFLRAAQADGLRCVEVVTGRGTASGVGVLRRELPMWLNLPDIRPLVLAAAHPHAANPGSVRFLLRRVR